MPIKTLLVVLGPTAVGKTELSLRLAERYQSPIISADSRQVFRDLPICTAAPTAEQLLRAKHYFVGTHGLEDVYSAAQFESDVVRLCEQLTSDVCVMSGGSMMYIDAVVKGIDDMPQGNLEIREQLKAIEAREPGYMARRLAELDPAYYAKVDLQNTQRVLHAVEVSLATGQPYSSFLTGRSKSRPFNIIKVGLSRNRDELYARIDQRVLQMVADGLEEESRAVYQRYETTLHEQLAGVVRNPGPTQAQPIPNLTPVPLNTVGLKEMLLYHEGIYNKAKAVERICMNTHAYARKQQTWFKRDGEILWFHPDNVEQIMCDVDDKLKML